MNKAKATPFFMLARMAVISGCFLIVAALALALHYYVRPPPLNQNRAVTRAKAFSEMRGAEDEGLSTPAWLDRGKGIVRLPIGDAMNLTLQEWNLNPAVVRSNLIARVEMATAPPAKATEKPSPFE